MQSSNDSQQKQGNSASTGVESNSASTGVVNQKPTAAQRLRQLKEKGPNAPALATAPAPAPATAAASSTATATAAASPNKESEETKAQKQFRERQKKLVEDANNSVKELNEAIAASNSRAAAAQAAAAAAQAETDAATAAAAAAQAAIDAEEVKVLSAGARIMRKLASSIVEAISDERDAPEIPSDKEFRSEYHEWIKNRENLLSDKQRFHDSVPEQFRNASFFDPHFNELKKLAESKDPKTRESAKKTFLNVIEYRKLIAEYVKMEEALREPLSPCRQRHDRVIHFMQNTGIEQLINQVLNGDGLTALQCFHTGFCPMILSFMKSASKHEQFFFSFNTASQRVVLDLHWKRMFRSYNKDFDTMNLGQEGYYVYSLQLAVYNFLTTVVPAVAHKRQVPIWMVLMNHCYIAYLSPAEIAKVDLCHSEVLLQDARMRESKKGPKEVVAPKGTFLSREDVFSFLLSPAQSKIIELGISAYKADWNNSNSFVAQLAEFMRKSGFKSFEASIECLKELGVISEEPTNIPSEKNPERMAYTVLTELPVKERFLRANIFSHAPAASPQPKPAPRCPSLKELCQLKLEELKAQEAQKLQQEKAALDAKNEEDKRDDAALADAMVDALEQKRAVIQAKVDAQRARMAQERASSCIASASDAQPPQSIDPAASALNAANDKLLQVLLGRLEKTNANQAESQTGSNPFEFLNQHCRDHSSK